VQVMVSRPLGRLRRPRFTPGHTPTPSPALTSWPCVARGLSQPGAPRDTVARLDLGSHVSGGLSARSDRPLSPFDRMSVQVMVSRQLGRLRRPRLRPATPRHHHLPRPPGLCVARGFVDAGANPGRASPDCRVAASSPGVRHAAARPAVRRCSRRARRSSREPGRGRTGARSH
jgi:hypothetical protein